MRRRHVFILAVVLAAGCAAEHVDGPVPVPVEEFPAGGVEVGAGVLVPADGDLETGVRVEVVALTEYGRALMLRLAGSSAPVKGGGRLTSVSFSLGGAPWLGIGFAASGGKVRVTPLLGAGLERTGRGAADAEPVLEGLDHRRL